MNKLLLLAAILIACFNLKGFSTGIPSQGSQTIQTNTEDSTIKKLQLNDPKQGFKDLFVSDNLNGMNMTQLNPMAISFVQGYVGSQSVRLNKMKTWGRPYFEVISTILEQHGLPAELKYLSVIESDLKSSAVSWVGAVGPWQLMPGTARNLGLKVNRNKDERTDYYKSTNAAAKYLTDLYGLFNDWLLVIAAYNGGPGHVYTAIRKSGSRNFWQLQNYLPLESRNHVKKFIATHYIMEGSGGLTTLTRSETDNLVPTENKGIHAADIGSTNVTGKYSSIAIIQITKIPIEAFNKLNPNFDKALADNGSYELQLPTDKMAIFEANKMQILEQSIRLMLASR
ncbi:MAG TPA: lytic transglycosylase domain-containing protein [Flavisolibacter sp.]|jgi:membrane-bound lytic murein transglycosylase D|nr:lytic transglycosylase domain-containing protein [Flavisolibacter sp.]